MGVTIREKPAGSGEYYVFVNHAGKRMSKKIGKDKRLAKEVAAKIQAKLILGDTGLLDEKSEKKNIPTLQKYVHGWKDATGKFQTGWLDKLKLSVKRSTRLGYQTLLKVHVLPEFGNLPLDEITPRLINNFILKKSQDGYMINTVAGIKNCLSAVLRDAVKPDEFISSNPARGISIPRPENVKSAREPRPFSWSEREIFEQCWKKYYPRHYPMILTALRTGLRAGELLALQWGDIDFHARILHVNRAVSKGRITTPKSQAGKRAVRMTKMLVNELLKLQNARREEKLRQGWKEFPEWVFCNNEGKPLNYQNFLARVWKKAMLKSKLSNRGLHDLRHTYATLRLSKGDSLAETSKEMGHSDSSVTFKTYYKWLPHESKSDIDELDNVQQSAPYTQPAENGLPEKVFNLPK